MQELNTEILKLTKELEQCQQENATYLTYEKRAQELAAEIAELRGNLADYNMLIDKFHTDVDMDRVVADYSAISSENALQEKKIDALFAERQKEEAEIARLQEAIEIEKQAAEAIINNMDVEVRERYQQLKQENDEVKAELEQKENELDDLTCRIAQLEEEMTGSEIKKESFRLHQQLMAAQAKLEEWKERDKETPQEERERLLQQVKSDNQEMVSIEKKTVELHEKFEHLHEELQQVEADIDDAKGERADRLKELKVKEKQRMDFLENFEAEKTAEEERIAQLQTKVAHLLASIAQCISQSYSLPTPAQLHQMEEEVVSKQEELKKATLTAETLEAKNARLSQDLTKVEELEDKIKHELDSLKEAIATMTKEIEVYSDLTRLQATEDEKRKQLEAHRDKLAQRKEMAKQVLQQLSAQYESEKAHLAKNDTYTQLGNLERKLMYLEQNNFVMKEFIATRQVEGNFQKVAGEVMESQKEYNSLVCQALSGQLPS